MYQHAVFATYVSLQRRRGLYFTEPQLEGVSAKPKYHTIKIFLGHTVLTVTKSQSNDTGKRGKGLDTADRDIRCR